MDPWFLTHLVCPRDHQPLRHDGRSLVCPSGHSYPVVDGVPVMLLTDVEQTHEVTSGQTIQLISQAGGVDQGAPSLQSTSPGPETGAPILRLGSPGSEGRSTSPDEIDPFVQQIIFGTCGYLYKPLLGKLRQYPIPEIRLPEGRGRLLLDIGCSWGRWSIAAARKGYQVVGIDPGLEAVRAARNVARQLGADARYLVADARFLPFPPSLFDVVFSYSVLQHFSKENARQGLREVARVLKPGGDCLIQMPNALGIRCLYHQARRGFKDVGGFEVRYWTVPELRRAFSELVGPSTLTVDGYFGLGIQPTDIGMLPRRYRPIVRCSEVLRKMSLRMPWMTYMADSVYVRSTRPA